MTKKSMVNKSKRIAASCGLIFSALWIGQGHALAYAEDDGERPGWFNLRSIHFAGSACPAGSFAVQMPLDGHELHLVGGDIKAEVYAGSAYTLRRQACQILLDIDYPSGYTYAVQRIETRGFVDLGPAQRGEIKVSTYFSGQGDGAAASRFFYGPTRRDFRINEVLRGPSMAPCGAVRALNVKLEARIFEGQDSYQYGQLLLATEDTGVRLRLKWKRCD